ncbi:SHOCT domain-containing protein [Polaromonas sp. JS666]|uniref:SHOCT domain-containing protein n=1 Tax=Polaromonas sp. (strain JS666 / ATCC BAA-500) TaxID=296591 RepID=UPI0000464063|nr:SHOCT domain-containing protein [Polaromonas sp. JS666]ABE43128.1 hypothetical protein Bpro_1177 [Polaromonas sp. JS666]
MSYVPYGYMMGMHALWWFFWIAAVIAVVIALVFRDRGSPPGYREPPRETPHEVLRRRLANGEISAEEYEKRKVILDQDS